MIFADSAAGISKLYCCWEQSQESQSCELDVIFQRVSQGESFHVKFCDSGAEIVGSSHITYFTSHKLRDKSV